MNSEERSQTNGAQRTAPQEVVSARAWHHQHHHHVLAAAITKHRLLRAPCVVKARHIHKQHTLTQFYYKLSLTPPLQPNLPRPRQFHTTTPTTTATATIQKCAVCRSDGASHTSICSGTGRTVRVRQRPPCVLLRPTAGQPTPHNRQNNQETPSSSSFLTIRTHARG